MAPDGSVDSVEGNTKPQRVYASLHWCFTLNNWNMEHVNTLLDHVSDGSIKRYCWQAEIGDEGTPHLQGYLEFAKKQRPIEFIGIKEIHWEKTKDVKASIKYCTKEDSYAGQRWLNVKYEKPVKVLTPKYEYQLEIMAVLEKEPDDRTIWWYWEPDGGVGKSCFAKYLAVNYDALILSGKGADCKYAIVKWYETKGYYPEVIVYDIPRVANEYVNYESLESIKNGLFFSGKYECAQVVMNSPHVFCFSNESPPIEKMSRDRWRIQKISI